MKLLVSDYDGTYDVSLGNIAINNNAIRKFVKEGNVFLLNTGRSFEQAKLVTDHYNIPYTFLGVGDGSGLYDGSDNLIFFHKFDDKIIEALLKFAHDNNQNKLNYLYPNNYSETFNPYSPLAGFSIVVDFDKCNELLKARFLELKKDYLDYDFMIYRGKRSVFLCVKPKGINKTSPIDYLANKKGIKKENIFAIGDGDNDIEMIGNYNGYHIGNNDNLTPLSIKGYNTVSELVNDIETGKVERRKEKCLSMKLY